MTDPAGAELDVRLAALRTGFWLGWLSIAAVLAGLALDLPARHRATLLALTGVAALANAGVMAVPRRWWITADRGRRMLNLWSAGLVALTATLILIAGAKAQLDLLLFLVLPFLATVHSGRSRMTWLAVAFVAYATATAFASAPLAAGEIVLRACLLAASTLLALVLGELTRRSAAARPQMQSQAELERALLAESHHRVKNSLQTVADLLLLGRPQGDGGRAFDETAARIRAIALVHRLLAEERGARVEAATLLETIAQGLAPAARVDAIDMALEPVCAQHLGIVANELIANAVQHGQPPIDVRLSSTDHVTLVVRDAGTGPNGAEQGLGLQLVQHVVAQGLHGSFALRRTADHTTQAEVIFDPEQTCAS